jgi:hypothetical protein
MALKHRLADDSYWLYGHARHKTAFQAAAQPGTAPDFSGLHGHKYALLVTFRRDGTAVPTPVWFALLDDRHFVAHRGAHGQGAPHPPRPAGAGLSRRPARQTARPRSRGHGPNLADRAECERAEEALDRHYGRARRIYKKLMADESGIVYLEVSPAARTPESSPN